MLVKARVDRDFYGKDGLSLLVLGESSYTLGEHGKRGDPLPDDWNNRIIEAFLERPQCDPTIKRAMDVFYDPPLKFDREEYRKFWQRTAFANFVQRDMCEPGRRPRKQEWREGQQAFQQYLLDLRPQFVLAVGFGLWDNLPPEGRKVLELPLPPKGVRPCISYPNDSGYAFVCGIKHTARGFAHKFWRPWVRAAMEEATRFHKD